MMKKAFLLFLVIAITVSAFAAPVSASVLDGDYEQKLCEDFLAWIKAEDTRSSYIQGLTVEDVSVAVDYGNFNGCEIVLMELRNHLMPTDELHLEIAGYTFVFGSSAMEDLFVAYREGEFLRVKDAYDAGWLTRSDILALRAVHAERNHGQLHFDDVPNSAWYYSAVHFAVKMDLFNGVSQYSFAPLATMTRAMLVTVLWRLEGKPLVEQALSFTDIREDAYYATALRWGYGSGIVLGTGDETFSPNDPVTREQLAVMLYRYAKYKGVDVSKRADLSAFPDASSVSGYAKDALSWANAAGLLLGEGSGSGNLLSPLSGATRAQVATIIMRFVAYLCS